MLNSEIRHEAKSGRPHLAEISRPGETGATARAEELARRYVPPVLARARRLFDSESEALEATRTVLARFLSRPNAATADIDAALHRSLIEVAIKALDKADAEPIDALLPCFDADGRFHVPPRDSGQPAAASFEHGSLRSHVRACLRRLPAHYRIAFVVCDGEGLTTWEAAQLLEVDETQVKQRLHLARQALRSLLEPALAPLERLPA